MNGDGELFHLDEILSGLNLSMTYFQQMCIAAGCDYLKNLKGIGINRAFQMVSENGNVLNALKGKERMRSTVKNLIMQSQFFATRPCLTWQPVPWSLLKSGTRCAVHLWTVSLLISLIPAISKCFAILF